MSDSYRALTEYYLPPSETMPRARAAAEKALQLDESLADGHASLGVVKLIYDWDWAAAEKEFRRAIELNPNLPTGYRRLAGLLTVLGQPDQASVESRRAQELDPLSLLVVQNQGFNLFMSRRFDSAIEQCRKALEMEPNYWPVRVPLGLSMAQKGSFSVAVAELEKAWQASNSPLVLAMLGSTYARAGRRPGAEKALAQLRAISKRRYTCPYETGIVHLELGRKDEFIALAAKRIRTAVDLHGVHEYGPPSECPAL